MPAEIIDPVYLNSCPVFHDNASGRELEKQLRQDIQRDFRFIVSEGVLNYPKGYVVFFSGDKRDVPNGWTLGRRVRDATTR